LSKRTTETINNGDFRNQSKKHFNDFTRTRKMPFEEVMLFMIMRFKSSTTSALRKFFSNLGKIVSVRQQSFSEARAKIKVEAFIQLFKVSADTLLEHMNKTWHGYRVLAIDGSKVTLPQDNSLRTHFGAVGGGAVSACAQGSILYDVLNDIVVDALITPMADDERTLAYRHLDCYGTNPDGEKRLVIFDRGYASFDLIDRLQSYDYHFVMRVRRKFNLDIDAQTTSDGYVNLTKNGKQLHVRVIKFKLDSGEEETLITNIADKRLGKNAFKKLYFMRWPIETKYNVAKGKLQIENFTSRTVEGVMQDFYATMYLLNATAAAAFDAQSEIDNKREDKNNVYRYKANTNELIGVLKEQLVLALIKDNPDEQYSIIQGILSQIALAVVPIRPNRRTLRKKCNRNVKFHHNIKVNC